MKRILPALLVVLVAFAYACQNTNLNNNNNGNVNANASPPLIKPLNHEKEVRIHVTNSPNTPGQCAIIVDREFMSIKLEARKDKVIWIADNTCDATGAQLIIGDFKILSNPSQQRPFGDDPYDNRFVFDPIAKGEEGRLISKTGKNPGKYEYTLRIVGTDGKVLGMLDPEVAIGG